MRCCETTVPLWTRRFDREDRDRDEQAVYAATAWLQRTDRDGSLGVFLNDLKNIVLTCLPCNYGRNGFTLEEMGLFDPRNRKRVECIVPDWDGLERLLQ
jgi:hypothetical protein